MVYSGFQRAVWWAGGMNAEVNWLSPAVLNVTDSPAIANTHVTNKTLYNTTVRKYRNGSWLAKPCWKRCIIKQFWNYSSRERFSIAKEAKLTQLKLIASLFNLNRHRVNLLRSYMDMITQITSTKKTIEVL